MLRNSSDTRLDAEAEARSLAERLSSAKGDDELEDAIRSIADQAAIEPETLHKALEILHERRRRTTTKWGRFLQQIRQMDFATRRVVLSAFLGLQSQLINVAANVFGDRYGLGTIASIVIGALAIYNVALTKSKELGMLTGAAFGAAASIGLAFFSWLFKSPRGVEGEILIPLTIVCGLAGFLIGKYGERIVQLRFQADPQKRREYLLKQLIELQEELKKGETPVTFLSVDVAGSTRIKSAADPLDTEYTFGEYMNYVRQVAEHFDGTLHSTAGDGALFAFKHPHHAFLCARRLLAGMIEFNAFKNRTGTPFEVRCGIHTGTVIAPKGDTSAVNYSHVIDVAAHAQKAAPTGSVVITEPAAMYLPGGPKALGAERTDVQGVRALVWRSHLATAAQTMHTTPPPPPPNLNN